MTDLYLDTTPTGTQNYPPRVCDYLRDRHGNQTTLAYDLTATFPDGSTQKLLTQVTDPSNRSLNFQWTNLGTSGAPHWRITQIQGSDTNSNTTYRVTYEYDASFQLWKVHLDPDNLNRITTFTYTTAYGESGLLASITDPLGHVVSYTYGNPASAYTAKVWVQTVTEPAGVTSGGATRTQTWTFSYSSSGTGSLSCTSGVTFTLNCTASSTTGLQYSVTSDGSLRTRMALVGGGQLGFYETCYDSSNNVTDTKKIMAGAGLTTWAQMTYTHFGAVLTQQTRGQSAVNNDLTTYTYYDASKYFQKASVTDPNGKTTTFDYFTSTDPGVGNRGEVKWVRDAGYTVSTSPSYHKEYDYSYNSNGQKATETNLNGVVTQYSYGDSWGNLTQVVQDYGTGKINRTTSMVYDMYGRVQSSTDPMSQVSSFTYYSLGQPSTASFPARGSAPSETITYTYEGNGRTKTVTDNRGTTTLNYENGCDRVASVTDPVTGTVSYTYLPSGERVTVTLPDLTTTTYNYHATNLLLPKDDPNAVSRLLVNITDNDGRKVDLHYKDSFAGTNTLGVVDYVRWNQVYSGGTLVSYCQANYTYDTMPVTGTTHYWLAQVKNTFTNGSGTVTLSENDYAYNLAGQRTNNQISGGIGSTRTEVYGYDELNRLSSVNYGDGQTQSYGFDAMGNRLSKSDTSTGSETYAFDNLNRLTTRNGGSYTSDLDGNTLSGGSRSNTWDSENRLVSCVYGGKTSAFTYGADGLRRQALLTNSDGSQSQTDYVLDGQSVVQEIVKSRPNSGSSWGTPTTVRYLMGPSGPLARIPSTATDARWYVYDGLGSVLGEVDVNGVVSSTRKWDVFCVR